MKNKSLLIESYLNVIKLHKLEELEMVKDINHILITSLINYYDKKVDYIDESEEKFLEKVVKRKISDFLSYLLYTKNHKKN